MLTRELIDELSKELDRTGFGIRDEILQGLWSKLSDVAIAALRTLWFYQEALNKRKEK